MDKQYLAGEDKAGQAKIIYQKVWSCNGLIPNGIVGQLKFSRIGLYRLHDDWLMWKAI